MNPEFCFHCELPIDLKAPVRGLLVDGAWRPVCCAGCEAVAGAILAGGFDAYYRLREKFPAEETRPEESGTTAQTDGKPGAAPAEDFHSYDGPEMLSVLTRGNDQDREAQLYVEGIRCSACLWLVESVLSGMKGVAEARVNHVTHRATVRWNQHRVRLSELLGALRGFGYRAIPWTEVDAESLRRREHRQALWRLLVAALGTMQVMMYALPAYVAGEGELSDDLQQLMNWSSLLLTVPVLAFSAGPFFAGAWRDLAVRRLGPDIPVALGIGIAFGASTMAVLGGGGEVWFDSISMFVFLLLSGRYAELLTRERAGRILERLGSSIPVFAWRLRVAGDATSVEKVATGMLRVGDRILVRMGDTVPADGVVTSGEGLVDQALLSGESAPLRCGPGSRVHAGAVNSGQALVIEVEQTGASTLTASIARMAERAGAERPDSSETPERLTGPFVASVIGVAAVTGVWWAWLDPAQLVSSVIAVLVATCPCAFALAAPVARIVSVAMLARRGVILARGGALEALAKIDDVVLDKTGTLTRGRMTVASVNPVGRASHKECIGLMIALESGSCHPIARAFIESGGRADPGVTQLHVVPGQGVEGILDGRLVRAGNKPFVQSLANGANFPAHEAQVWLGDAQGLIASFDLRDEQRPGTREVLAGLKGLGLRLHLVSGDSVERVMAAARAAGITHWQGGTLPAGKRDYVADLQGQGRRVLMVGDGINDAPVLAQADASVAMGDGAALAQIRADAILVPQRHGGELDGLLAAIIQARRTDTITRQNLRWAMGYNFTVLPLAMAGWLSPWAAAIGMSLSSALVMVNALRLANGTSSSVLTASSDKALLVPRAEGKAA